MRTTVTLDKDVERLLRDAAHRSRSSFKKTINSAIRAGLTAKSARKKSGPFMVKARPLGLRAGIDPATFNRLADDLEAETFLMKTGRLRKSA